MNNVIITGIVGIIISFFSGFTAWFYTRKKYNSEVANNLIQNMQKSLDFYTKLSDDNTERLDITLSEYEDLRKKFEEVLSENTKLRVDINILKNQITNLTRELKKFSNEIKIK